jgi:hypothetical protein
MSGESDMVLLVQAMHVSPGERRHAASWRGPARTRRAVTAQRRRWLGGHWLLVFCWRCDFTPPALDVVLVLQGSGAALAVGQ